MASPTDRPAHRWAWWALSIGLPAIALVTAAWVAPRIPVSPVAAYVAAFACVGASMLGAARAAPYLRAKHLALLIAPAVVLAIVGATRPPILLAAPLVTASLLLAGTTAGGVVGGAIQRAGHLIVVAIVSSLVDVFSVLHPEGPTQNVLQVERAVALLILPWPMLGTSDIRPILGVGDVVFAALYFAACEKHGLPMIRTATSLVIALALTMLTVLVTGIGIPALPFFGAAIVLAHPRARRLEGKERKQALFGVLFLAALIGLLFALRS